MFTGLASLASISEKENSHEENNEDDGEDTMDVEEESAEFEVSMKCTGCCEGRAHECAEDVKPS